MQIVFRISCTLSKTYKHKVCLVLSGKHNLLLTFLSSIIITNAKFCSDQSKRTGIVISSLEGLGN